MMTGTRTLTRHDERRLAVTAYVDPRTIRKYFAGALMKPMTSARIEAALVELHWTHLKRLDVHHPMEGIT